MLLDFAFSFDRVEVVITIELGFIDEIWNFFFSGCAILLGAGFSYCCEE